MSVISAVVLQKIIIDRRYLKNLESGSWLSPNLPIVLCPQIYPLQKFRKYKIYIRNFFVKSQSPHFITERESYFLHRFMADGTESIYPHKKMRKNYTKALYCFFKLLVSTLFILLITHVETY